MMDALGETLSVGDEVIAIATMWTNQTLYRGTVVGFQGNCVSVRVDKLHDDVSTTQDCPQVGDEKRICVSHRVIKV